MDQKPSYILSTAHRPDGEHGDGGEHYPHGGGEHYPGGGGEHYPGGGGEHYPAN